VLQYEENGTLLPPRAGITIVEDSEMDSAYRAAGIEHGVTTAQTLIATGYRNRLLLKLAPDQSSEHDDPPETTGDGTPVEQRAPANSSTRASWYAVTGS
jgi:hypothetical protein